ncbi:MAG: SURF1 family protein [Halieaceae bacterium]|nr:SURF1 family protein [Halieaceae bacterium]
MTALRLDLEWRTTLFTVLLFPALISLGVWQLDRAQEKEILQARNDARSAAAPVPLASLDDWSGEALADRRVRLSGRYLAEPLLFIDNQVRDGRYGHDVVSIFLDAQSQMLVLLNRGWIAGDPARRALPQIETPVEELELEARVYVSPGQPYRLASERYPALDAPLLIQQNNSPELRAAIEKQSPYRLFPRPLRLVPGETSGFRRDWPVVNQTAQKHRAYALQWFTMAAALALVFLLRSSNIADLLRRRPHTPDDSPPKTPRHASGAAAQSEPTANDTRTARNDKRKLKP